MAVTSLGVLYNPGPTFFERNERYCPLGQYGYDEDIKTMVRVGLVIYYRCVSCYVLAKK